MVTRPRPVSAARTPAGKDRSPRTSVCDPQWGGADERGMGRAGRAAQSVSEATTPRRARGRWAHAQIAWLLGSLTALLWQLPASVRRQATALAGCSSSGSGRMAVYGARAVSRIPPPRPSLEGIHGL